MFYQEYFFTPYFDGFCFLPNHILTSSLFFMVRHPKRGQDCTAKAAQTSHIGLTLRYNFARPNTCPAPVPDGSGLSRMSGRRKCRGQHGDVLELADRHDLGSCAERREGSIPSVPTFILYTLSLRGRRPEANPYCVGITSLADACSQRNNHEGNYELENRKNNRRKPRSEAGG